MKQVVLGGFVSCLVAIGGCAASNTVASTPAPAATLAAAVVETPRPAPVAEESRPEADPPAEEPAPIVPVERVKHHVEITVDKLPKPKSLQAAATTYVFWVRASEDDAWANAAHLASSDEPQVAEFEYPDDTLYVHVTAEPSADARAPSSAVLLSTKVAKSGACASSVDQNELKMRVRMCR